MLIVDVGILAYTCNSRSQARDPTPKIETPFVPLTPIPVKSWGCPCLRESVSRKRKNELTRTPVPEERRTLYTQTTFDVLTELFRNKVKRFRIVKHRKATDKLESESTHTTVSFWLEGFDDWSRILVFVLASGRGLLSGFVLCCLLPYP